MSVKLKGAKVAAVCAFLVCVAAVCDVYVKTKAEMAGHLPASKPRRPVLTLEMAAVLALVAIYAGVFGTSAFGGDDLPDFLDLRTSGSSDASVQAEVSPVSEVLGVQTTTPATPTVTPELELVTQPPPTLVPMPAATPAVESGVAPSPTAGPSVQPSPTPTAQPAPAVSHDHLILYGETLTSIALQYDVEVAEIMHVNQLTSDLIFAGQTLLIPVSGPPSAAVLQPR